MFYRLDSMNEYRKKIEFIKIDENKIINMACVKWVKKMDECMEICTKGNGCYVGDTHQLCKKTNAKSYNQMDKYFK